MIKLLKIALGLVAVAGAAYVTFFVPLGERTLYQHLSGIAGTDEARELGAEIEKKATDVKEEVAAKVPVIVAPADKPAAGPEAPLSDISGADRRALDELLHKKNK